MSSNGDSNNNLGLFGQTVATSCVIVGPTGPQGTTGVRYLSADYQILYFDILTGNIIEPAQYGKYFYTVNIYINSGKIGQILVSTKSSNEIFVGIHYFHSIYGKFENNKIVWVSQDDFTDFAKSLLEKAEAIVWRVKELNLFF